MRVSPDNPNLCRDVEQFLSDSDIQLENIPVTIVVNPPIRAEIEDVGRLSEILNEMLTAYRTEGNYFLELRKALTGIMVVFGIEHTASVFATEVGHC